MKERNEPRPLTPRAKDKEKPAGDDLLHIVRGPAAGDRDEALDLDLDEFEADRRYGREDIADK